MATYRKKQKALKKADFFFIRIVEKYCLDKHCILCFNLFHSNKESEQ